MSLFNGNNDSRSRLNNLPPGEQQVNIYSCGQISPIANDDCNLQNQNITITTFSEVDACLLIIACCDDSSISSA
jgi:hypothetical protein